MGLNGALAVAGHSLEVFSAGIQTAGHNISNAATPGYIREKINLQASDPYRKGNIVLGTGVHAESITLQIDRFLESRIHAANSEVHTASARNGIFKELEAELRELGAGDLSTTLSDFLASIHETVNQPESAPLREFVVAQGRQLAGDIGNLRTRLDDLRTRQTTGIDTLVDEANALIVEIGELNTQIVELETAGLITSDAGATRTRRYNALNRLSEIIPIRFTEHANGSIDVFTSTEVLVLGPTVQTLETQSFVDRGVQVQTVQLSRTKADITELANTGGEINGLIQGRDTVVGEFVDQLDRFAAGIIEQFNRIHASGEGLIGSGTVTAEHAVADTTAALNSTTAGLSFPPTHGSFQIKVKNTVTGLTETTTINVDLDGIGSDTTLDSLQTAINAVDDISATIGADGRLTITADANFEIRFSNDTSGALTGLGINTFFTGTTSDTIGVSTAIAADHRLLATGQGAGPSDSRNVELLAEFSDQAITALGERSIREFYEQTVSAVSQASAAENALAEGLEDFRQSLKNQREQISGVSIDEETIQILEFQHSFQAAARLVSVIDELFGVLLAAF